MKLVIWYLGRVRWRALLLAALNSRVSYRRVGCFVRSVGR